MPEHEIGRGRVWGSSQDGQQSSVKLHEDGLMGNSPLNLKGKNINVDTMALKIRIGPREET